MTNWNKYGSPLEIRDRDLKSLRTFLDKSFKNVDDELYWDVNDEGEIYPVDSRSEKPYHWLPGLIEIVKWLKKNRINHESGYAFTYQNEEDPDERSVGGINSNNEGVTFIEVDGDGKITKEFHKI